MRPILLSLSVLVLAAAPAAPAANPPAEGFDLEGSDRRAIEIADAVMERMGGRDAWDATRHLRWRFFGRRLHVWDRFTNDVRIEGVSSDNGEAFTILMNLDSGQGRAWVEGAEVAGGKLAEMLDFGEAVWINDSYWLLMPYKLKDSGVTLTYEGEGAMEDGRAADVLQLTFEGVGRTPQNKYHVYVARDSGLVEQWDFYTDAGDTEPRFSTPWLDWRRYGGILLSDDRGENDLSELAVFDRLPASVYQDPAPVDWPALE